MYQIAVINERGILVADTIQIELKEAIRARDKLVIKFPSCKIKLINLSQKERIYYRDLEVKYDAWIFSFIFNYI